ncbi:MAG: hypothetical protein AB7S26_07040 [Sandaracinaceae bacterium]
MAEEHAQPGGRMDEEAEEQFRAALAAAEAAPDDDEAWDLLEDLAESAQRPEEVGALYRKLLGTDLSGRQARALGERAVNFHEQWFSEDSPHLAEVLRRLFELDPSESDALQRLTVVLTVAEKWNDLLGLYDRALEAAKDEGRREELLDEAAQLAKDFAGEPDRAIIYLSELFKLRPKDAQLVSSLERLLERQGRWEELIALWRKRVADSPKKKAMSLRGRIAACYLENLEDAASTLREVRSLLDDGAPEDENVALLERIVALESSPPDVREGALDILRERYEGQDRPEDVVRVLTVALEFASGAARIALHRELGDRVEAAGQLDRTIAHWAAVLRLDPGAEDIQARLATLARKTDAQAAYADALVSAADAADAGPRQYALLMEAGHARAELGERDAAIQLYQRVLDADAVPATKLAAGRRLEALLDQAERLPERLAVLEGLAELEADPVEKRRVLGQCARLAERLGESERALGFWDLRLGADPSDLEALDAMIELSGREHRWNRHVEALRRRTSAGVPRVQRRLDLGRIAATQAGPLEQLPDAIETWRQITEEFGEDAESVDALFELLARAGRHDDLYAMLERASTRDAERASEVLARLADVSREHLGRSADAARAYHRAIELVPGLTRAQDGLKELLHDDGARGAAVRGLAKAYQLAGAWESTLELLEPRIELAPDDEERVRVLREAAQLYENNAGRASDAFDQIRRALGYDPANHELESELVRLAEASDRFREAADALGTAAKELAGTRKARAAELHRHEARVRHSRTGDASGAQDAMLAALALQPHDAPTAAEAIRLGAEAGRWEAAAAAAVRCSLARDELQEDLIDALEHSAIDAGALAQVAAGVAAEIPAPGAVRAELGRMLEGKVAGWLRDQVGDASGAEAALVRALAHESGHVPTLRELAELRRKAPSRALVDTLIAIAGHFPNDLDPVGEAADLAKELGDADLVRSLQDRLHRTSRRLWEGGQEASGQRRAEDVALASLDALVDDAMARGDLSRAADLLVDGARMPVSAERSRELRTRAAELSQKVGDEERALRLSKSVVEESVENREAVDSLAVLLEQRGRLPELLALRQRQLELDLEPEVRLWVRLEIARILGGIEATGGRIGVLRQNLEEQPGHAASCEQLAEILTARKQHDELSRLFTTQAGAVERLGEPSRAADLWARAAVLFETSLGNVDSALDAYRRVVSLEATPTALDALARLHLERGEPAVAAEWLHRRFESAGDDERGPIALRLAGAHIDAGNASGAMAVLERLVARDPSASEARRRLAALYREANAYEPLAQLLSDGAPHEDSAEVRLAYVREAADLYENQLNLPDRAIPILQMGIELAPDDNELKSKLALGLRVAGRLDEARAILEALAESFGRRRSPERAAVHFQLAQVAHAGGDLEEAQSQLEKARKMDMSHPGILRMAGRLAAEAGQLDRAEKAYRALLLVVRRLDATAEDLEVGASEVLYELSAIAKLHDDEDQADELLETALATAAQADAETDRFVRDLLRKKDQLGRPAVELALSAVERRLKAVKEAPSEARMLARRAEILGDHMDRAEDALDALLKAIDLAPEKAELHDRCRALAKRMGAVDRYIEALNKLAEKARRKEDASYAADLLMRLGEVTERDKGDLDGAAELYQRVEKTGSHLVDAWQALARVAEARGDSNEEVRVLRQLVDADPDKVPSEPRTMALYRIAEVELAAGRFDDGLSTLRAALAREPRYARAGAILQTIAQEVGVDEALLDLYHEVARSSGDPQMVLDYLEREASSDRVTLETIKEGVDRADAAGESERAEVLLRRGVAIAEQTEGSLRHVLWVPTGLAERRKAAGDVRGAIEWMRRAADAAEEPDSQDLKLKLAELAASEGGDLHVAADTYRELLATDPGNRALWEPLAHVYAKLGDKDGLVDMVSSTLDALLDPSDRNELRMFYASFLLEHAEARDEAVMVLKNVLDEEPDHVQAARKLAALFEESGDNEQLVELHQRQLDRARDRQDVETIVALSLQMGGLIEPVDTEQAIEFYRSGLDWAPTSRDLLAALLRHHGPEAELKEKSELMERLLAVSEGEDGSRLARELIAIYRGQDDEYGAARALDLGFRANPSDFELRDQLERSYREREDFEELASMIAHDAAHRDDPASAVARAREAAQIYREQLYTPAKAAEVMRTVWRKTPDDLVLLEEVVSDLKEAGLSAAAADDVSGALEQYPEPSTARAHLLRMRASLETSVGNVAAAVDDLEASYAIDPGAAAQDLAVGLDAYRRQANEMGDPELEQRLTHRLATVLTECGNPEQGRDVLAEWVERAPHDAAALRTLRSYDGHAERWEDVARHNARLIEIEQGEAQVEDGLALADACRRMGQPGAARAGLEFVFAAQPSVPAIRAALKALYEESGALRELATFVLEDAYAAEGDEARFELFRRAGDLMIQVGDAEGSLQPLAEAARIQPEDHALAILLADAYVGTDRLQEAVELLQHTINGFKKRRSPELAAMQLRMARIAGLSGDPETQKEWLSVALDADKNNGEIAAELAELAMQLNDDDTALKALRVVTLQKEPGPMSKAVAFLHQAKIAYKGGDQQKAILWARRARLEDDSLREAEEFLTELGE